MVKSSLLALLLDKSLLALLVLFARAVSGNRAPSILEHPLDMTVARWAYHFQLSQPLFHKEMCKWFAKIWL